MGDTKPQCPNAACAYCIRGKAYEALGEPERAIIDYKTSAKMGHKKAQEILCWRPCRLLKEHQANDDRCNN
jgi:hypothetical protein